MPMDHEVFYLTGTIKGNDPLPLEKGNWIEINKWGIGPPIYLK
jgi:hypothetical protein